MGIYLIFFINKFNFFRIRQLYLSKRFKHALPDLPYDYNALEPVISAEIMKIHHQKHHGLSVGFNLYFFFIFSATYVNNLNVTEEKIQEALAKGLFYFLKLLQFIFRRYSFGYSVAIRSKI